MQLIHQRKEHTHLLVVGQVQVPPEDRELLKRTMGEGFKQFVWDLELSLLNRGVDFVVIGEGDKDPDAWGVHLRIYLREFDPSLLQSSYTKIKNSLIAFIWSYRKALDHSTMSSADPSEPFSVPGGGAGTGGASEGGIDDPARACRTMNAMANTGIIMMVTLMDGFAQTMMEATGAMAWGMAEEFGDEEGSDQVADDIENRMPDAKEQMMNMVSEMRTQLCEQMAQKADEIGPLLAERMFEKGPEILVVYEFGPPKLTEDLDDETIAEYAKLLVQGGQVLHGDVR